MVEGDNKSASKKNTSKYLWLAFWILAFFVSAYGLKTAPATYAEYPNFSIIAMIVFYFLSGAASLYYFSVYLNTIIGKKGAG